MKTINIKGKDYIPVVERVKELHKLYPGSQITTEIINNSDSRVIIKASVHVNTSKNPNQGMYTTYNGHSQAEWGKGMMGNVALEVAETSAVGRALGFAGIGIDTGIASADEIRKVSKVEDDSVPF